MKCETKFGESISVTGSVPELGRWKNYDFNLKWTAGHIWVSEQPIVTKVPYFSYKYVKLFNGKMKHWEGGIDRIVDLELLAAQKRQEGIRSYGSQTEVEISDDVWQEMKV